MCAQRTSPEEYAVSINSQYGQPDLGTKILAALEAAGKDLDAITRDDLMVFDEIHMRGREATIELAKLAGLREGMKLLDVGSGIGGPARTLAADFGCIVTGIDLTDEYCQAAEMLTARAGLSDKVTIRHANALDMPFDDESFDVVWMQHMWINIEDKKHLLDQIRRVLQPSGRLALYEIFAGSVQPPHFPVVWASDPMINFLLSAEEGRQLIVRAGLVEIAWNDVTERCIEWFRAMKAARPPDAPPPLGYEVVVGPDWPQKGANTVRNLQENRILGVEGVFECKQ